MRPSVPDVHITDSEDQELAAYRVLAGQAVLGLIFGLLAPAALVDPLLWFVPVLGILLSVWAIRRIKKDDSLTGRKLAIAGLMLSLVFAAAAPTDWLAYRRSLYNEARQFSLLWFEFLAKDEPHKAHHLTVPPQVRHLLDENLWAAYRSDPGLRHALRGYVQTPLIQTLLALGSRAHVRFFETLGQDYGNGHDIVFQSFAVTFEEEGEKKSFFVAVQLWREKLANGRSGWRIAETTTGVRPEGW